jgi:mannose-6-phosphate isomerase class I
VSRSLDSFGLDSCDSFFMNLMELKKGEGMYVGADGPHAWLKGDIVELMAVR